MTFKEFLLKDENIPVGGEKRLMPMLDVSKWDRLHFHIGSGAHLPIRGLYVKILFATLLDIQRVILADSTIWYEDTVSEREFIHTVPSDYDGTGFVMSVPVVAPHIYDIILKNQGSSDLTDISVAVMAQEI